MIHRWPIVLGAFLLLPLQAFASPKSAPAAETPGVASLQKSVGFSVGTGGGFGGEASLTLDDLARGLPLAARFAVGYRVGDPGIPLDARHVFINNNDNGTPQEGGRRWDFRLDAVYRTRWLGGLLVAGGPRYSRFDANFKFVGGNEFFDVKTNQWGLGLGAERRFPMSPRTQLTLGAGLDYYANATLTGHDTSYSPDGSSVNPHENYNYSDADAAIAQPHWAPRFMVGVGYRLGD